jgi:hypothetical protein
MPTLFNHHHFHAEGYKEQTPELFKRVIAHAPLFAVRALPLSRPGDVVQLDPRCKEAYPYFEEHLKQVGLETATDIIWDISPEVANDYPDYELSCFRFNPSLNLVRPNQRRLDATDRFNNKNEFIALCQRNGYRVPRTIVLEDGQSPPLGDITYPVYVKSAVMASGLNIYRCQNEQELRGCIGKFAGEYQIQDEVPDVQAFISTHYSAASGRATHHATTGQLLDGFSHVGNTYPVVIDPRAITDPLADQLAGEGLEDFFGFDLAVNPNGLWLIECNARFNGATYPILVAQRLGIEEWTARKFHTVHQSLRTLDLQRLAFDSRRGHGVVVLMDSFMPVNGEITVLLAGSEAVQEETQIKLSALLQKP